MTCPALTHLLSEAASAGGSMPAWVNGANTASLVITVALVVGTLLRFNRKVHPPLMVTCFLADLGLVVWLEVTREAVETAAGNMSPLMAVHIALAVAMLVLYAAMLIGGIGLLRAAPDADTGKARRKHRMGAVAFFAVRIAVLATAVMVAGEVPKTAPVTPDTGAVNAPGPQPHRVTTKDGKTIP